MIHTPPLPGVVATVLTIAARLRYRQFERTTTDGKSLVVFTDGKSDYHLILTGGSGVDCGWAIVDVLPAGFVSIPLTNDACAALREGRLDSDGSIVIGEKRFRLRLWHDGSIYTATLAEA